MKRFLTLTSLGGLSSKAYRVLSCPIEAVAARVVKMEILILEQRFGEML
jgi:hypothetical protein